MLHFLSQENHTSILPITCPTFHVICSPLINTINSFFHPPFYITKIIYHKPQLLDTFATQLLDTFATHHISSSTLNKIIL